MACLDVVDPHSLGGSTSIGLGLDRRPYVVPLDSIAFVAAPKRGKAVLAKTVPGTNLESGNGAVAN